MIKEEFMDRIKIFEYYDENKKYNMNVYAYIPEGDIQEMKVVFVMSGCLRDALNYLKNWINVANKNQYIIITPEFDKEHYSISEHEYGNLIDIEYDYSSQDIYTPYMKYSKIINHNKTWIYKIIDDIYIDFITKYCIENNGYILFGHSSGSQFAHRFLMFGDSKYCKKYLCANAGQYTFFDETKDYPYGIKNLKKYKKIIDKSLEKEVYILVGDKDLKTDYLNCLPMDMEEGENRLQRAQNFFKSAEEYALKIKIDFKWKLVKMEGIKHNNIEVIPFAVNIINSNM